ncbi:MAG: porin [Porticoccaceae bacterium]|nr:porin [Porticoccaceae bacterium]
MFKISFLTVLTWLCFSVFTSSSFAVEIDNSSLKAEYLNNDLIRDLDVGIRINLDSTRFAGMYREDQLDNYNYDSQLRRARLTFKLPLGENWSSKLQVAINESDDTYETKDLYLRYRGFDFAEIRIGQSKEPFGLENITSSANTLFTERALSTFSLGRSKGINLSDSNKKYSWSVGVYNVEKSGKVKADGDKAYTARYTLSPVNDKKNYNHFGMAYSTRDLQGAEYEIKTNGGVDSAINFLDTRNIATNTIVKKGVEAAWGRGALSLQGEFQHLKINALDTDQSAEYQGYYTQLSYFLTDDHRPYKKGRFANVKPTSSMGAWELNLRKGTLQTVRIGALNKNNSIDITTTVLGLNYYLNKRMKLMLNTSKTNAKGILEDSQHSSGKALTLRVQIRL